MSAVDPKATQSDARMGVIFDVDGVLIDSAEPHFRSWKQLAQENGATVTREQFSSTFGRQNRDIIPLLFGHVSQERQSELAERKEAIYRALIGERAPIVPGAVELARGLHEAGVALAVGSSGPSANIELVLAAMRIRELIRVVVTGDDVTRGKPDPQVFSLACRRLSLPPGCCVVVEDAPVGIEAAKSAGAKAVAVLMHHPGSAFPAADLMVDRLADLTVGMLRRCVQVSGE